MKLFNVIKRPISLVVVICFTLTSVIDWRVGDAFAAQTAVRSSQLGNELQTANNELRLPNELGTVDRSYQPVNSVKVSGTFTQVYYIQDAHTSLEAQENISKVIQYLVKEKGAKRVLIEGFEGNASSILDTLYPFKDSEAKSSVSHFFLDYLRLSGAQYSYINRTQDFLLQGIESSTDYIQNIKTYENHTKNQETVSEQLLLISKPLKSLASQVYPQDFQNYLKLKERFETKKLSLADYIFRLLQLAVRSSQLENELLTANDELRSRYPHLSFITQYLNKQNLTPEEEKELNNKLKTLDTKTFFGELKALEEAFTKQCFVNAARSPQLTASNPKSENELRTANYELLLQTYAYQRQLELLNKLNQLTLTPEEYKELSNQYLVTSSSKDKLPVTSYQLRTQDLAQFLANNLKRFIVLRKEWEELIQDAYKFYELVQKRDETFQKNIMSNLYLVSSNSENQKLDTSYQLPTTTPIILVAGGFHQKGITDFLEQKQISYVTISPKITKEDPIHEKRYNFLMSGQIYPFEKQVTVTKGLPTGQAGDSHQLMTSTLLQITQPNQAQDNTLNLSELIDIANQSQDPKTNVIPAENIFTTNARIQIAKQRTQDVLQIVEKARVDARAASLGEVSEEPSGVSNQGDLGSDQGREEPSVFWRATGIMLLLAALAGIGWQCTRPFILKDTYKTTSFEAVSSLSDSKAARDHIENQNDSAPLDIRNALVMIANKNASLFHRFEAIDLLVKTQDPTAMKALVDAIKNGEELIAERTARVLKGTTNAYILNELMSHVLSRPQFDWHLQGTIGRSHKAAISVLMGSRDPRVRMACLKEIQDPKAKAREEAMQILVNNDHDRIIDVLMTLMRWESSAYSNGQSAIPYILKDLYTPNDRKLFKEAIESMDPELFRILTAKMAASQDPNALAIFKKAVKDLAEAKEDEKFTSPFTPAPLDAEAIQKLIQRLKSGNADEKLSAALMLQHVQRPEVTQAFLEILLSRSSRYDWPDDNKLRSLWEMAVVSLEDNFDIEVVKALFRHSAFAGVYQSPSVERALRSVPEAVMRRVLLEFERDPNKGLYNSAISFLTWNAPWYQAENIKKQSPANSLAASGSKLDLSTATKLYDILINPPMDPREREEAAKKLKGIREPVIVQKLLNILESRTYELDTDLRIKVLIILEGNQNPALLRFAIKVIRERIYSSYPLFNSYYESALAVLAETDNLEIIRSLVEMANNSKNTWERASAIRALGCVRNDAAQKLVLEKLKDPKASDEERSAAIKAVSGRKDPEIIGILVKLSKDPDENIRCLSISAMTGSSEQRVIQALEEALKNPSAAVNKSVIEALLKLEGPEAQAAIARHLRRFIGHPLFIKGEELLKMFENTSDSNVIQALLKQLNGSDEDIAISIMKILSTSKDPTVIAVLRDKLASKSGRIRHEAAAALKGKRDAPTIAALVKTLQDPNDDVRLEAVLDLADINTPEIRQQLNKLINDEYGPIAESVFEAFMSSQNIAEIRSLLNTDQHPGRSRWMVAKVLKNIQRTDDPELLSLLVDVRLRYGVQFYDLITPVVDRLNLKKDPGFIKDLKKFFEDPEEWIKAVASHKVPPIQDPDLVKAFLDALQNPSTNAKIKAARALTGSQDASVQKALAGIIEVNEDLLVRMAAIKAAAGSKDPTVVRTLLRARMDNNPGIAEVSEKALRGTDQGQENPVVLSFFKDQDSVIRAAAAKTAVGYRSPEVIKALVLALEDPNDLVQLEAIRSLKGTQAQEAIDALLKYYNDDKTHKTEALASMYGVQQPKVVEAFLIEISDPKKVLCDEDFRYMESINKNVLTKAALKLLGHIDPTVQITAIKALQGSEDGAAIRALIQVIKGPSLINEREAALALALSPDAVALQVTATMLNSTDKALRDIAKAIFELEPIPGRIGVMTQALASNDPDIRALAAEKLKALPDPIVQEFFKAFPQSVDDLVKILKTAPPGDPAHWAAALLLIKNKTTAGYLGLLEEVGQTSDMQIKNVQGILRSPNDFMDQSLAKLIIIQGQANSRIEIQVSELKNYLEGLPVGREIALFKNHLRVLGFVSADQPLSPLDRDTVFFILKNPASNIEVRSDASALLARERSPFYNLHINMEHRKGEVYFTLIVLMVLIPAIFPIFLYNIFHLWKLASPIKNPPHMSAILWRAGADTLLTFFPFGHFLHWLWVGFFMTAYPLILLNFYIGFFGPATMATLSISSLLMFVYAPPLLLYWFALPFNKGGSMKLYAQAAFDRFMAGSEDTLDVLIMLDSLQTMKEKYLDLEYRNKERFRQILASHPRLEWKREGAANDLYAEKTKQLDEYIDAVFSGERQRVLDLARNTEHIRRLSAEQQEALTRLYSICQDYEADHPRKMMPYADVADLIMSIDANYSELYLLVEKMVDISKRHDVTELQKQRDQYSQQLTDSQTSVVHHRDGAFPTSQVFIAPQALRQFVMSDRSLLAQMTSLAHAANASPNYYTDSSSSDDSYDGSSLGADSTSEIVGSSLGDVAIEVWESGQRYGVYENIHTDKLKGIIKILRQNTEPSQGIPIRKIVLHIGMTDGRGPYIELVNNNTQIDFYTDQKDPFLIQISFGEKLKEKLSELRQEQIGLRQEQTRRIFLRLGIGSALATFIGVGTYGIALWYQNRPQPPQGTSPAPKSNAQTPKISDEQAAAERLRTLLREKRQAIDALKKRASQDVRSIADRLEDAASKITDPADADAAYLFIRSFLENPRIDKGTGRRYVVPAGVLLDQDAEISVVHVSEDYVMLAADILVRSTLIHEGVHIKNQAISRQMAQASKKLLDELSPLYEAGKMKKISLDASSPERKRILKSIAAVLTTLFENEVLAYKRQCLSVQRELNLSGLKNVKDWQPPASKAEQKNTADNLNESHWLSLKRFYDDTGAIDEIAIKAHVLQGIVETSSSRGGDNIVSRMVQLLLVMASADPEAKKFLQIDQNGNIRPLKMKDDDYKKFYYWLETKAKSLGVNAKNIAKLCEQNYLELISKDSQIKILDELSRITKGASVGMEMAVLAAIPVGAVGYLLATAAWDNVWISRFKRELLDAKKYAVVDELETKEGGSPSETTGAKSLGVGAVDRKNPFTTPEDLLAIYKGTIRDKEGVIYRLAAKQDPKNPFEVHVYILDTKTKSEAAEKLTQDPLNYVLSLEAVPQQGRNTIFLIDFNLSSVPLETTKQPFSLEGKGIGTALMKRLGDSPLVPAGTELKLLVSNYETRKFLTGLFEPEDLKKGRLITKAYDFADRASGLQIHIPAGLEVVNLEAGEGEITLSDLIGQTLYGQLFKTAGFGSFNIATIPDEEEGTPKLGGVDALRWFLGAKHQRVYFRKAGQPENLIGIFMLKVQKLSSVTPAKARSLGAKEEEEILTQLPTIIKNLSSGTTDERISSIAILTDAIKRVSESFVLDNIAPLMPLVIQNLSYPDNVLVSYGAEALHGFVQKIPNEFIKKNDGLTVKIISAAIELLSHEDHHMRSWGATILSVLFSKLPEELMQGHEDLFSRAMPVLTSNLKHSDDSARYSSSVALDWIYSAASNEFIKNHEKLIYQTVTYLVENLSNPNDDLRKISVSSLAKIFKKVSKEFIKRHENHILQIMAALTDNLSDQNESIKYIRTAALMNIFESVSDDFVKTHENLAIQAIPFLAAAISRGNIENGTLAIERIFECVSEPFIEDHYSSQIPQLIKSITSHPYSEGMGNGYLLICLLARVSESFIEKYIVPAMPDLLAGLSDNDSMANILSGNVLRHIFYRVQESFIETHLTPSIALFINNLSKKDSYSKESATRALTSLFHNISEPFIKKHLMDAIRPLIKNLSDNDPDVQSSSADALEDLVTRASKSFIEKNLTQAVPHLIGNLSHVNHDVRYHSTRALAAIISRLSEKIIEKNLIEVIPPLVANLSHENPDMRYQSELALIFLFGRVSEPFIEKYVTQTEPIISVLLSNLSNKDPRVRRAAEAALVAMGPMGIDALNRQLGLSLDPKIIRETNRLFREIAPKLGVRYTFGAEQYVKQWIYLKLQEGIPSEELRGVIQDRLLPGLQILESLESALPPMGIETKQVMRESNRQQVERSILLSNYFMRVATPGSVGVEGGSHILETEKHENQGEIRVLPGPYPLLTLILDQYVTLGILPDKYGYHTSIEGELKNEALPIMLTSFFMDTHAGVIQPFLLEEGLLSFFGINQSYIGQTVNSRPGPTKGMVSNELTQTNIYDKAVFPGLLDVLGGIHPYRFDLERKGLLSWAAYIYLKNPSSRLPAEEVVASQYQAFKEKIASFYQSISLTEEEQTKLRNWFKQKTEKANLDPEVKQFYSEVIEFLLKEEIKISPEEAKLLIGEGQEAYFRSGYTPRALEFSVIRVPALKLYVSLFNTERHAAYQKLIDDGISSLRGAYRKCNPIGYGLIRHSLKTGRVEDLGKDLASREEELHRNLFSADPDKALESARILRFLPSDATRKALLARAGIKTEEYLPEVSTITSDPVRQAAFESLRFIAAPSDLEEMLIKLPELIQDLSYGTLQEQTLSAHTLADNYFKIVSESFIGEYLLSVIPILEQSLSAPSVGVRSWSAYALDSLLKKVSDRFIDQNDKIVTNILTTLIKSLSSEDPIMRSWGGRVLTSLFPKLSDTYIEHHQDLLVQVVRVLIPNLLHPDTKVQSLNTSALSGLFKRISGTVVKNNPDPFYHAIPILVGNLSSLDENVRSHSATALDGLQGKVFIDYFRDHRENMQQLIPPLIKGLSSPNIYARSKITAVLSNVIKNHLNYFDQDQLQSVISLFNENLKYDDLRLQVSSVSAIAILFQNASEEFIGQHMVQTIEILIQNLNHKDDNIRYQSAQALENMLEKVSEQFIQDRTDMILSAVPLLIDNLKSDNQWVRSSNVKVLECIFKKVPESFIREHLLDTVSILTDSIKQKDDPAQWGYIFALAQLSAKVSEIFIREHLVSVMPNFINNLKRDPGNIKYGSLRALRNIFSGVSEDFIRDHKSLVVQAVPALMDNLRSEIFAGRLMSVQALSDLFKKVPGSFIEDYHELIIPPLIAGISHEDPDIRSDSLQALDKLVEKVSGTFIQERFLTVIPILSENLTHRDADVITYSAYVLAKLIEKVSEPFAIQHFAQTVPILLNNLKHEDASVRSSNAAVLRNYFRQVSGQYILDRNDLIVRTISSFNEYLLKMGDDANFYIADALSNIFEKVPNEYTENQKDIVIQIATSLLKNLESKNILTRFTSKEALNRLFQKIPASLRQACIMPNASNLIDRLKSSSEDATLAVIYEELLRYAPTQEVQEALRDVVGIKAGEPLPEASAYINDTRRLTALLSLKFIEANITNAPQDGTVTPGKTSEGKSLGGKAYAITLEKTGSHQWRTTREGKLGARESFLFETSELTRDTDPTLIKQAFKAYQIVAFELTDKDVEEQIFDYDPGHGYRTVMLTVNGRVAGVYRYDTKDPEVTAIAVAPDFRGMGAIDVLLEDLVERFLNGDRTKRFKAQILRKSERAQKGRFYGAVGDFKRRLGVMSQVTNVKGKSLGEEKVTTKSIKAAFEHVTPHFVVMNIEDYKASSLGQKEEFKLSIAQGWIKELVIYADKNSELSSLDPILARSKFVRSFAGSLGEAYDTLAKDVNGRILSLSSDVTAKDREKLGTHFYFFCSTPVGAALLYAEADGQLSGFKEENGFITALESFTQLIQSYIQQAFAVATAA